MNKTIAIVNRTNLKNYGSVLQVYALMSAVRKLGYDSEVVWQDGNMSRNFDIRPNKLFKTLFKLISHPQLIYSTLKTIKEVRSVHYDELVVEKFDSFVNTNIRQCIYRSDELSGIALSDKYSKFICGSDQIWCSTTLYPDPMMYLRFAPVYKRIAYAPSIGRDYVPGYNKSIMKRYISEIPCLSIREDDGKRIIKELTGLNVPVVADPTLLLNSNDWDKLKIKCEVPVKYVLCYFLDTPSEDILHAIDEYCKETGCVVVAIGITTGLIGLHAEKKFPKVGPGEFLFLTSKAHMVITDSYHGMLFAINYRRNFWAVERAYSQFDQSSRQISVLSRLNLMERYLRGKCSFNDVDINYEEIHKSLKAFVNESMEYLKSSIED